jgi:hypothetical protein
MAVARIYTSQDIVNGIGTVIDGSLKPTNYDNKDRDVHIPSGDSLQFFQTLDKRYRYHGGVGGSGNWEH